MAEIKTKQETIDEIEDQVGIALAGVVQGDPFDGLARALADGLACLAGFAALGKLLGLRAGRAQ